MNGYELLVPYVLADRQARVEAERLARLAQKQAKASRQVDEIDGHSHDFAPEPWVPVLLRGYPYDAEFSR
jgi:hypothetical protein